jgi:FKBP-type peptidyl-prolyl cis-trans isomerase FkpA
MRQTIIALTLVTFVAAVAAEAAGPNTDEEKTLYAIGLSISGNLAQFDLTPAELEQVKAGIEDGLSKKPRVEIETFGPKIGELLHTRIERMAEAEKKSAETFLAKAAAEKGAEKKASGLIYTEVKAGDGKQPTPSDRVKVQYTGKLRDGTVFESSAQRGGPAEFSMQGIVQCWTEALQLMKEHGKARFVCPPDLAYGDHGKLPKIRPGAALAFEAELLEVLPGDADPHAGGGPGPADDDGAHPARPAH